MSYKLKYYAFLSFILTFDTTNAFYNDMEPKCILNLFLFCGDHRSS